MSGLTKLFSIVLFGGLSAASIQAWAMTTTNTDELYAENLRMERSSAEIPGSIDSGTMPSAAVQEDYVLDSSDMGDVPVEPKAKKDVAKNSKAKRSSSN